MRKTRFILFVLAFMMFGVMNAEIASGTCGKNGDNITWVLDDDGTLTLSGSGEMKYYYSTSDVPWYSNREKIIKVSISEGLTSICDRAFSDCSGLTSVSIPNSVTSIESGAFSGCNNIKSIYYNSKVSYKFESNVREVYYGDDVTIIYPISSKLSYLNKVVLGKNVEYLRQEAFKGAPLREFYITGEKDIYLYQNVFQNVSLSNATLYVPKSRAEYYKTTAPWNEFGKIVDLDGNELPEAMPIQCATPTISFNGEEILFACETEGATIHYTISPADNKSGTTTTGKVAVSGTYNVTAYATADGCVQSESVTKTIKVSGKSGDFDGNGVVNIEDVTKLVDMILKK